MKHIKIFLSFLLISAVFLCSGCNSRSDDLIDNVTTPEPLPTAPADENGIIKYTCMPYMSFAREKSKVNKSEIYALTISPVWHSQEKEFEYIDGEKVTEEDIDTSVISKAAEWLYIVYNTVNYADKEQMDRNLKARESFLSSELKTYISGSENLPNAFMPGSFRQTLHSVRTYYDKETKKNISLIFFYSGEILRYKDKSGNVYNGILLQNSINLQANGRNELQTSYIKENDYYVDSVKYEENGSVHADIGGEKYFLVLFNENNEICSWAELWTKASFFPETRYLYATKNGVMSNTERLQISLEIDPSFKYSKEYTLGSTGRKMQQVGISCYKEIIGLSGSANDNYFDSFLNNCSEELKSALQKSGILEEMIADARKYKIKFTLDPKSTGIVDKELSMLEVYRNTDYGDVYKITRACYLKTGSNEFNKKYGLPEDARFANFVFYVADENGTGKLVAFDIHARLAGDEFFNDLDQVWQGNWDNG